MTRICICGGGSLGHVCAGVLASQPDVEVNLLTQHPEQWAQQLKVTDLEGKVYQGKLAKISRQPADVLTGCDIIFFCLPGFAIEGMLTRIKPYVNNAIVGSIVSSTGFFFAAHRIIGSEARLFGFQRTPFIARTDHYGRSANLLGYKSQVAIATENIADSEGFRCLVEKLWLTPTQLLGSFYDVALTNSNPILHTARLYTLFKDWHGETYDYNILFYKEWTDEASETLIAMDSEFQNLLRVLPTTPGAIPTLLDYYESHDAHSLTHKISHIPAFQAIVSPMKEVPGGWIPDFQSRYFTEDFPFGLKFIADLAHEKRISTPIINNVYSWGMSTQDPSRLFSRSGVK